MVFVLFLSCTKDDGKRIEALSEGYTEAELNAMEAALTAASLSHGFALIINTGLYVLERGTEDTGGEDTRVVWGEYMSLGESITLGQPRRLYWTGANPRHLDFIEVRRSSGSAGWALASQVAVGGRLAVVTEDRAFLYSQPRIVDVSRYILSRKTIVVYFPETESDGFVEIRGYDIDRQEYVQQANRYIRLAALSRNEADIQSAILLHTAMSVTAANQAERRGALLDSALLYYPDSVFYDEILEIVHPNISGVFNMEEDTADNE
ncbi:MAG: hypothetical protein FWC17_02170 [Treponema sp.]|nr:hypothetical protein [Treponema sp.]